MFLYKPNQKSLVSSTLTKSTAGLQDTVSKLYKITEALVCYYINEITQP